LGLFIYIQTIDSGMFDAPEALLLL